MTSISLLCPLYFEYEVVVAIAIQCLDGLSCIFSTTVAHKRKTLKENKINVNTFPLS